MMTALFAGNSIGVVLRGHEDPLPCPFASRVWMSELPGCDVSERCSTHHRQHRQKSLDSVSPDEYVRIRSVASFMIRDADDGCRRFLERNSLSAVSRRIICLPR